MTAYPWGYDVHTEVIPKPAPIVWTWRIGPVAVKAAQPPASDVIRRFNQGEVIVQLTADQQVDLSITGEDRYGNPVEISGDVAWLSSDESVVQVTSSSPESATATAVGPAGTASVTVTNDADRDGTGDFMGSLAIDVVAGEITEIAINAGEPTTKP